MNNNTILDELARQEGGNKELAKKAGVCTQALRNAKKGGNVVGYTYNLAKRLVTEEKPNFKLQIIEDGHLITISREKI